MSEGLSVGSVWRRWDPHIHTPGTTFNDQYTGPTAWEDYLEALNASSPTIEAIGITDYYSLECYKNLVKSAEEGRLPHVGLIFPNVEMRYAVGTNKAVPVNFHILVSPEDPNHIREVERFLARLTFKHLDDTYRCTRDDVIALGRAHAGSALVDEVAFREGANQFKVEVDAFLEAWADTPWIQRNALIAVPGSNNDGTAGLQGDASLAALRQKIERAAHIIFASQPAQRSFWLGQGKLPLEDLIASYGGPKPCLHGSDAHSLEKVGAPALDRFCWLKGDLTFETLRQACMEPELRVLVAQEAPTGPFPSQTVARISVEKAPWFASGPIPLNSGLVGVIGARGSGKTALADMIAAATYAASAHADDKSFVHRAAPLLGDATAVAHWADGSATSNQLSFLGIEELIDSPRVRYLSQQFVERLCAADGASDELVQEIERVIFATHPKEDRLGAENFRELLNLTAARGREARTRQEAAVQDTTARIALERDKQDTLAANKAKLKEAEQAVLKDRADRDALVPKEAEAHAKEFSTVSAASDGVRQRLEVAKRRKQALALLRDEIDEYTTRGSHDELRARRAKHQGAALADADWEKFLTIFKGDVAQALSDAEANTAAVIEKLEGRATFSTEGLTPAQQVQSLLPDGADLAALPLSLLSAEEDRLRLLIGADEEKRKQHERLTEKIRVTETQINNLKGSILAAELAGPEIERLLAERTKSYQGVFEGVVSEEEALNQLYKPLSERLHNATGALGKLSFSVRRIVDLESWAARGEELIDKRKAGDFKGKGALLDAADAELANAWRSGTSSEVASAMAAFRSQYDSSIAAGSPVNRTDVKAWRAWGTKVSDWLYSTNHIRLAYTIRYEGVELKSLSPGTRGIVLLLLYLAIDLEDDRPLIIDQPEENLDPRSIYDELVTLFREAKRRRQIIVVTHNANLVVNTDADQVIVAQRGSMKPNSLPDITYLSGSLENLTIRKHVCDILEGGERAFQDRAKRLRVRL